jgi:hypothetical protein
LTTKADFSDDEWARLRRAPFVAGMAISLADPGGPIEAVKESAAALKTVMDAGQQSGKGELVDAIAADAAAQMRERHNPLADFKPSKGAMAGEEILEELRAANEIVTEKASAEDADAYREWLMTAAQRAADAAKEGGFIGFGAERVSEGEQRMLDKLREVLAAPAG